MRRALLVSVLVGALLACSGGSSSGNGQTLGASFSRFDGSTASFADYRGKPVVVNFFSSTCTPCVTEMPAFERIHQQVGSSVVFLGMDVQDTVDAGRSFVESVGITWDLGRDPDAAILKSLGGVGLPTTVLLDSDGRVVFKHLGALPPDELTAQLRDHRFTT